MTDRALLLQLDQCAERLRDGCKLRTIGVTHTHVDQVEASVDPPVGSVGDAYALAESQIGLLKTELIPPSAPGPRGRARRARNPELVDWFDSERTHKAIDDLTPVQAKRVHYTARNRLTRTG
ncbi:hypothetical protein [Aeromicrobium sp. PE09-221]|uniref:hypothetical protein n=1 Tax=Aeromicrobium sp. PE09-221 TaxID=1898043 RepID=UPI001482A02B|nr:hypothetical protein [Aeromicrobium sp. PE09-221]